MPKTRPLFFAFSKNPGGKFSIKQQILTRDDIQIRDRIRVDFRAYNDTYQGETMVHYGPSENQKFAILIKPENFDLIVFMSAGYPLSEKEKTRLGDYFTFTISKSPQQSIANRKIETPEQVKAPWNKLNPEDRKIAYVSV